MLTSAMKPILTAFLFFALQVSCRKDHTCVCTASNSSGSAVEISSTIKATKKKAQKICRQGNGNIAYSAVNCQIN